MLYRFVLSLSKVKWFVVLSLFVIVALLLSACQPIQKPAAVPTAKLDDVTVAKIEALIDKTMSENQVPGFAIGIVKDDEVVYAQGFGVAAMDPDRPMTTETLAAAASLSKQFTTAAVMQLVDQGKIDLDASVNDYLPYFKLGDERYKELTIRHLLANTSGLTHPDFATAYDYTRRQTSPEALEGYVRSLADRKMEVDPADWSFIYSNDNWDILADVIAIVTSQPFEEYVTQNVIEPLGLKHTTFFLAQADHSLLMASHWLDENGKLVSSPEPPDYDQVHTAPGGIITNINEMMKWSLLNLNRGEFEGKQIVPASAYEAMWKPFTTIDWGMGGLFEQWGLGWALADEEGHPIAWWGGIDLGSNMMLFLAPEDDLAIVTVTNATKESDQLPWYSYDIGYPVLQLLLGVEPQAAQAESAALDDATTAEIETILTDIMQPLGVPGYAMCIVQDGSVVYDKGFGVTNVGGDQPVTPQSVFIIYSTTKSFTAVALMQLVEQGKVDLDTPVTTYLPYFTMADPGFEQITVRMLASHMSGLIDDAIFQNMPPKSEEPEEIGAAIEWFVRALADDTLTAALPTAWQYASTNFILLGDIIGKVSGEPYDVYVTKHLLEPLGMTHSTLAAATIPPGALVGEHSTTAEGAVEETAQSYSSGFDTPAAGIYSTCEDMTRWMQVHANRGELDGVRILQAESYDSLWNKEAPTGMDEFFGAWSGGYGLGWSVGKDGGHFLASHPGGGAGQTSNFVLAPDDNLGVTVLANWGMDDSFPAWTAAADVLNALLGIEPQETTADSTASTMQIDEATVTQIEGIVQQAMTDYPVPGFELCIVKEGQVAYSKGFGLADVASGRPMTPRSVSTQASISKSMTAMAIMQLVEKGKIDLDTPVTTYLPYFTMDDPRHKDITVRMLLSHMSGLPDVPMHWAVPLDPAINPLEQAVRSLSDQQLLSTPGEQYNYSGWGYSTLGDIIAKVTDEPFESAMQQHVLKPLGMANSTFVADEVDPDLYVTGYVSAEDGSAAAMVHVVDARDVPNSGLWTNCEDMTKWAKLMLNKGELDGTRLLQPESIDAMWTSVTTTPWLDALGPWYGPYVGEYGLGWYVGEKAGHRLAGHAGAGDGVNTQIQFAPDDGLAVIAIDNWLKPDPDWYPAGFAAFDVMDLLLGIKPQ